MPLLAQAQQYSAPWYYSVNPDNTLTITGYDGPGGSLIIPATINGMAATMVGSAAFSGKTGIQNIVISSGIVNIGSSAFANCGDLTNVLIADGVTNIGEDAFEECPSLISATVPGSVTMLGSGAFVECASLTTVTLGDGVASIGDYAFAECPMLTAASIPGSVTNIGQFPFGACDSLSAISVDAGNKFYESINGALYDAARYTLIECPGGFAGNYSIPDGVITVEQGAFDDCRSLSSVSVPSSVTNIGDSAFYACVELTSITVDTLNPFYSSTNGVLFDKSRHTLIQYPFGISGAYAVPDGVADIGEAAFNQCTSLTGVTIPASVTNIGESAFAYCSGLGNVIIPTGVISIDNTAFIACTTISNITIFGIITNFGDFAFAGCTNLTAVYFETPPNLNESISLFAGDNNAAVYFLPWTSGWDSSFYGLQAYPLPQSIFTYSTNADNTLTITGCGWTGPITLPAQIGGLSITAIGDSAFFNNSAPSITMPAGITSIGDLAFYGASNLTGVTIPSGVTNIGSFAFYGCSGLTSITIPQNVTAIGNATFSYCTNLSTVAIPAGVASVGELAFYGCSNLPNIVIPDGVTNIGDQAFGGCLGLTNVYFQGNAPAVGSSVFYSDDATISYLLGATGWSPSFAGLSASMVTPFTFLTNADNTLTVARYTGIGGNVTIPIELNGRMVSSVGAFAFAFQQPVTSVVIPDGVTNLGYAAFSGIGITNVVIPNGITSLGTNLFEFCGNLRSVTIPDGVTSTGVQTFGDCSSLTSITLGSNITSIGESAFSDCISLTNVTILGQLTNIGGEAFDSCAFSTFSIPSSVTSIGISSFDTCLNLTNITIPASVTNIGETAFELSSKLSGVYFEGNAPSFGPEPFVADSKVTLYYLPGTAGWSATVANVPALLWNPAIQTDDGSFGVLNARFGFNITGTSNIPVVVEACDDLARPSWTPLKSFGLTNGLFYFSDPDWTNYSSRFYRLCAP